MPRSVVVKFALTILLLIQCTAAQSSTLSAIYGNAQFDPADEHFTLESLWTPSLRKCACECASDPMCLMAQYHGYSERCIKSCARLDQGSLRLVAASLNSSVIVFIEKQLPRK
jgi:hypothetical protein